ncbi:MAG: hypothetical protein GX915_04155 [Clostridiales bacterium]|nr:hypothetical protein [Clostridiales bacterium]
MAILVTGGVGYIGSHMYVKSRHWKWVLWLEMTSAFSKACNNEIHYEIKPRQLGDISTCYADPTFAQKKLEWKAIRGLDEMCEDAWRWQKNNPMGYEDE